MHDSKNYQHITVNLPARQNMKMAQAIFAAVHWNGLVSASDITSSTTIAEGLLILD
jgi:hypothetical protein